MVRWLGRTLVVGLTVIGVEEGMIGGGRLHACYPVPKGSGLVVVSDGRHDCFERSSAVIYSLVGEGRCDG